MFTYLRNLQTERDSLTQAANALTETAATETRDLTESEHASIAQMQQRCVAIDDQLRTYGDQLTSQRAYAALRANLADDDEPDPAPAGTGYQRRDAETVESWGELFTGSEAFRNYSGHGTSSVVSVPLETRAAADPITSASMLTQPYVFAPTQPRPFSTPLLDLIASERVSNGSVQWLYWLAREPEAGGPVAEGAVKPAADMPAEVRDTALETYAHWKTITRQALEDIPRIQSIVSDRLRVGLARRLEREATLAITNDANVEEVSAETLLGAIRVAAAQLEAAGYPATGVALNPNDWAAIDVAIMAGTLNGPVANNGFWGIRPVAAAGIPEGTAFVGAFGTGVTLFDRGTANVFLTDSHADLFIRNTLLILAETRAKVVVNEPYALLKASAEAAGTTATAAPAAPAAGNGGSTRTGNGGNGS